MRKKKYSSRIAGGGVDATNHARSGTGQVHGWMTSDKGSLIINWMTESPAPEVVLSLPSGINARSFFDLICLEHIMFTG